MRADLLAVTCADGATADDDPEIPPPPAPLGAAAAGEAPLEHDRLVAYLELLAERSERVTLLRYGTSVEGRPLVAAAIGDPANVGRLEAIWDDLARLGDHRAASEEEAARLRDELPAGVWVGCGLHGDETSGGDMAALAAYRLAAGRDPQTAALLRDVLVYLDPAENPDGRVRWMAGMRAGMGAIPSHDLDALDHDTPWPGGRGNHYLIDLNRDLIGQTQPETRRRTALLTRLLPQLVVEVHEMESDDTFLFASPGPPFNPLLPAAAHAWWERLGADHGAALDRIGTSWYRGEWNEVFYPGYMDIWPAYTGAATVLYEAPTPSMREIRRAGGRVVTYAQVVTAQLASLFANLATVAGARRELLADWAAHRRSHAACAGGWVLESHARWRLHALGRTLRAQGIEVERDAGGTRLRVREGQPLGRLARVLLQDDVRPDDAFLAEERELIAAGEETRISDHTAWSLAHGHDVRCDFAATLVDDGAWSPFDEAPAVPAARAAGAAGLLIADEQRGLVARLLGAGVAVRVARRPFVHADRRWPAGSFLVRSDENDAGLVARALEAAPHGDAEVVAAATSRCEGGFDLGGRQFALLALPRVALIGGEGCSAPSHGAAWHLLDVELGIRHSRLDHCRLPSVDPGRYDMIVVPAGEGLTPHAQAPLAAWAAAGGTLVSLGGRPWADEPSGDGAATPSETGGAYLRVALNVAHDLACGVAPELPVLFGGVRALPEPGADAVVVGRFAPAASLVAAGVVWPDAVAALAGAPYLVDERVGRGRVVRFAADPLARGIARGTRGLLCNALLDGASGRAA